jgi:branched-chain amino acid transport system ATP-binding protein
MHLLEVQSLTHSFGGLSALSDVSIRIDEHELAGVIGPNGAGKTTLFNIITGIYSPTKGNIFYKGAEIAGVSPNRIASLGIARTFQNIRLFKELSVLDNVRTAHYSGSKYGPLSALFKAPGYRREERKIQERSRELLSLFHLDRHSAEKSKNLSYGLQRRLEIARALALKPKLLLLDEPAAGMNPQEIDRLMELILWIRKEFNLAILLIEHQMQLVMNICEKLTVLDFGVVIGEGKPHEVQENQRVLEAYLGEDVFP